ncbi:hypothetical protein ABZ707_12505 [Streptomyces sp. NPDC006923]|uniref:hypothetical protein n=1 Tax=Streptomyces sp. NPDC006923 TaxID=3155355 RepID=UPI0033CF22FF
MTPTLGSRCAITVASLLLAAPAAYAEESPLPAAVPVSSRAPANGPAGLIADGPAEALDAPADGPEEPEDGPAEEPGDELSEPLAGRPAGEGRIRPGRPAEPGEWPPEDPAGEESDTFWDDARGHAWDDPRAETGLNPSRRPGRSPSPSTSPSPSASASPTAQPTPEPSRESGRTDEGNARDQTWESEDPADEYPAEEATPRGSRPPSAARKPVSKAIAESMTRPIPVLTLGAGITLIGLGLGFLGMRLRHR